MNKVITGEEGLKRDLKCSHGVLREVLVGSVGEVLADLPHEPVERKLGEEKLGGFGQLANLSLGNGARPPPTLLLLLFLYMYNMYVRKKTCRKIR